MSDLRGGFITSVATGHYIRPAQHLVGYLNNFNFRSENLILVVPDKNYTYELFKVLRNKNDVSHLIKQRGQFLINKLDDGGVGEGVIVVGLKKTHEVFKSVELHVPELVFLAYGVALYHLYYIKEEFGVSNKYVGVWNNYYDVVLRVIGQYWDLDCTKYFKFKSDFKKFESSPLSVSEFILSMLHSPKKSNLNLDVLFKTNFNESSSMSIVLNGSLAEKYSKALVVLKNVLERSSSSSVSYRVKVE